MTKQPVLKPIATKRRITHVVVHEGSDEAAGVALLFLALRGHVEGGITKAMELAENPDFIFWDKDMKREAPSGPHIIAVGCLGGSTDEHARPGYLQNCAAKLVAEYLGIENRDAVKLFLKHVLREDRLRQGDPLEVPKVYKHVIRYGGDMTELERFNWALQAYWAELSMCIAQAKDGVTDPRKNLILDKAQSNIAKVFGEDAATKWREVASRALAARKAAYLAACEEALKIGKVVDSRAGLKVVTVSSDNAEIGAACREVFNADIVIRHTPKTGHVVVLTNQRRQIDLYHTVLALRKAEHEARGLPLPDGATKTMHDDPAWPHWEGHIVQNSLDERAPTWVCAAYNGTDLTAKGVEPTKLPLDRVLGIVLEANPPAKADRSGQGRHGFQGSAAHRAVSGQVDRGSRRHHGHARLPRRQGAGAVVATITTKGDAESLARFGQLEKAFEPSKP